MPWLRGQRELKRSGRRLAPTNRSREYGLLPEVRLLGGRIMKPRMIRSPAAAREVSSSRRSDNDPELRITGYLVFSERLVSRNGWPENSTSCSSPPFAPKIVAIIPSNLLVVLGLCRKLWCTTEGELDGAASIRCEVAFRFRMSYGAVIIQRSGDSESRAGCRPSDR